ncbi:hypothetical protein I552_1361 [Mycobacterium xenopi 3993]|nr:hypothetical protein I552_1361 [Mycobacterium xenopi 3993]
MYAAANYARANRQILGRAASEVFLSVTGTGLELVYDISHNLARIERHDVAGDLVDLCVHRKGATRALPPGHPELPTDLADVGQPVLIPGSMGTSSYVLAGSLVAVRFTPPATVPVDSSAATKQPARYPRRCCATSWSGSRDSGQGRVAAGSGGRSSRGLQGRLRGRRRRRTSRPVSHGGPTRTAGRGEGLTAADRGHRTLPHPADIVVEAWGQAAKYAWPRRSWGLRAVSSTSLERHRCAPSRPKCLLPPTMIAWWRRSTS